MLLKRDLVQVGTLEDATAKTLTVLQWNVFAQGFATSNEFTYCASEHLTLEHRMPLFEREITALNPDIVCLQEADIYVTLGERLNQSYECVFEPKGASACLKIPGNLGSDGVAIFYKKTKLRLSDRRIVQLGDHGRIALIAVFNDNLAVCVTHLKAKFPFQEMRLTEGQKLMEQLREISLPLLVCGDFNAEPWEPVIQLFKNSFKSAYYPDPPFTTWKFRQGPRSSDGNEVKHTIDYIFYSPRHLQLHSVLALPTEQCVGPQAIPNAQYPSDHFNLFATLSFL
ncbi:Nocturnin [Cichlidogyrus casuarinus]|uniref:Nocturnin n=1 Tax=Cichlidogyrus casuarinus TaxID=1844966 RepID=A0ABD2Q9A7_9PLAT